jgi:NAD(P) transhydrogenase subunit alpha
MIDALDQSGEPLLWSPRPSRRRMILRPKCWIAALALLLGSAVILGDRPIWITSAWGQDPATASPSAPPVGADEPMTGELADHGAGGSNRRETILASLTIFVLAVFLGFELITKVPPTLHTPLMSGSNAISGITLVGAIVATGVTTTSWWVTLWGALAVILATINAVGGFAVTHRMLSMFRRN